MTRSRHGVTRRQFTQLGTTAAMAGLGVYGAMPETAEAAAQQTPGAPQATPGQRPEALKSEFLMDMILETQPAVTIGPRTAVAVSGGTFEGPRLRGKVIGPGADWPLAINPNLRVLDVRTLLVTDDDQRIYMTYRGIIYTPPEGQGPRYWRTVPIFETDAKNYEWLTQAVFVGVSFQVPQRVSYRIFQIL
jgi:hypothetical protein